MLFVSTRMAATPWRDEFRACLGLGVPLILTNAIEMALNLTNAAMIGRIAPEALAASTIALAFYNLCLMFGIGLAAAVSPLIARERGEASPDRARAIGRLAQGGLWNSLALVVPIWVLLWWCEPLFRLAGQDPQLSAAAASYLHVLQWSLLPALIYLSLRSVLAALERPRWTVVIGLAAVPLNALLNWLLIDGHAGLPAMGINGSAIATVTSNIVMAGGLLAVTMLDRHIRPFRIVPGFGRPPFRACADLWRLGGPIGIGIMLEVGMFTAATALIGHYDVAALASHAIALQIASFTFMVPLGIAQAATVRVGKAAGAHDGAAVGRAGAVALMLGIGTMAVSALLLIGLPAPLIALFVDAREEGGAQVAASAAVLLGIAGLFQLADGAQVVLSGMLRGLRDSRGPMVIALLGYWGVGLPMAAALAVRAAAPGVWVGLTAGLCATAALLYWRWTRLRTALPQPPSA
ncbi:MATE family efflux transporter [Lichenihabitans sp. Uapishka_5]|uniref:MATE family efflux transporter n=1 Tax=Lichenihabitans sp. Uapishka_5 TaxID=3037302 RepID=UPI0029E80252|nr:MATE family efflux transporter [Lichenihabitans sp. Uapishka_5]MDX7950139.1 MATE family efflux transporter [Lichenihabitans sp. Uapishka_5]